MADVEDRAVVHRSEWLMLLVVGSLALLVASLPYLIGYAAATPETVFNGFPLDLEDSYSHLAKMQQGLSGTWRYRLLFTPEDHPGVYLNTFYLALGNFSRLSGLSLLATYHLARLLTGALLLGTAYRFISDFLMDRVQRRMAFLFLVSSSGLGWLLIAVSGSFTPGGLTPMDFWLLDAYTFLTLMTFPHMILAIALLLLLFRHTLIFWEKGGLGHLFSSFALALALTVIHPFSPLLYGVVLAAYYGLLVVTRGFDVSVARQAGRVLSPSKGARQPSAGRSADSTKSEGTDPARWRPVISLAGLGLLPLPLVVYSAKVLRNDPIFASWSAQNVTPSPPIVYTLLGYGLLTMLAIPGGIYLWRKGGRGRFLVLWMVAALILMYLPFKFQRRMVEGLQVPVSIVATAGLYAWLRPWLACSRLARWLAARRYPTPRLLAVITFLLVAFAAMSNLYFLAALGAAALERSPQLYYSPDEIAAIEWLGQHTSSKATVLSSYEVGGLIPARIGHPVYWGHWCETAFLPQKEADAVTIFAADTDQATRHALLAQYGIAYLFYGPRERALGDFNPEDKPYLMRIFSNSEVSIYRVFIRHEQTSSFHSQFIV
jgi:hypothetical protein